MALLVPSQSLRGVGGGPSPTAAGGQGSCCPPPPSSGLALSLPADPWCSQAAALALPLTWLVLPATHYTPLHGGAACAGLPPMPRRPSLLFPWPGPCASAPWADRGWGGHGHWALLSRGAVDVLPPRAARGQPGSPAPPAPTGTWLPPRGGEDLNQGPKGGLVLGPVHVHVRVCDAGALLCAAELGLRPASHAWESSSRSS